MEVDLRSRLRGRVERLDDLDVHQRVHLGEDARLLARAGALCLLADQGQEPRRERVRRHRQLAVGGPGEARKGIEKLAYVLADLLRAGEQAHVGVDARGGCIVVAGGEVHVAANPIAFATDHQGRLGVDLQLRAAVEDVHPGPLQRARPLDVVALVEARLELDGHGHLLAVLRRGGQALDDVGAGAGAVERHLDRQDVRVRRRLPQEREHRRKGIVGVVQQHVAGADGREHVAFHQLPRHRGNERRVVQVGALQPGERHQGAGPQRRTAFVDIVPIQLQLVEEQPAHALRRLGIDLYIPPGDIGIIGASGTGIQEVSCLIARAGGGISHAIGTGGRDLKAEVGAITTLMAMKWLKTTASPAMARTASRRPARHAA